VADAVALAARLAEEAQRLTEIAEQARAAQEEGDKKARVAQEEEEGRRAAEAKAEAKAAAVRVAEEARAAAVRVEEAARAAEKRSKEEGALKARIAQLVREEADRKALIRATALLTRTPETQEGSTTLAASKIALTPTPEKQEHVLKHAATTPLLESKTLAVESTPLGLEGAGSTALKLAAIARAFVALAPATGISRVWALGRESDVASTDLQEEMLAGLRLDNLPDELLTPQDVGLKALSAAEAAEAREGEVLERWRRRAIVYQERTKGVDPALFALFKTMDPRATGCIPKGVLPTALTRLGVAPSPAEVEGLLALPGSYVTAAELHRIVQIFVPQIKPREVAPPTAGLSLLARVVRRAQGEEEEAGARAAERAGLLAELRLSLV